jgi:hypothetical protein
MGGMGGKQDGQKPQDSRRVVIRPTPNTEPVFGELERQGRPRRRQIEEQQTAS